MRIFVILSMLSLIFMANCGSSSGGPGEAIIDGPDLSIAEAEELEVNQIYVKELSSEGSRPFFSVYIQDALSDGYMVCSGPGDGLSVTSQTGVYYGNLSVPMAKVDGSEDHNTPVFNIVIVADQDNPCPAPIADGDQIVATVRVNFGELMDQPIEFGDGAVFVAFKGRGHKNIAIPDLEASETDALVVGEISFQDVPAGDIIPNYYMVLYVSNGYSFIFKSMIDPADMPEMREAGLIYSKLSLAFPDTVGIGSDNILLKTKARIELLKNDAVTIGKTKEDYLGDIIGRKIEFTNGQGFIRLKRIAE